MATTKLEAQATWTSVFTGACLIQLTSGGKIRLHFGSVAPAEDTEDYILVESHSRVHRDDRDSFYYPFADQVWVKQEQGVAPFVVVS